MGLTYEFQIRIITNVMAALTVTYLCINLPSAKERKSAILAQAEKFGISIEMIPAVAGKELPAEVPEYDRAARKKVFNHDLIPNEIACTLSHIKALETFLASGAEYGVILEDDAVLAENFVEGIRDITEKLHGWEIAKLYTEEGKLYPLGVEIPGGVVQPIFPKKILWVAVGYLYTRRGAARLLEHMRPFCHQADVLIAKIILENQIPTIGVTPSLVTTSDADNTKSTIDDTGGRFGAFIRRRSFWQYLGWRWLILRISRGKQRMRSLLRRTLKSVSE